MNGQAIKTHVNSHMVWILFILLGLAGCAQPTTPAAIPTIQPATTTPIGLPNPASVHCQEKGYTLEIRTATDGSQHGVCIFPGGSECDEWAFYRGECGPTSASPTSAPPSPQADPYEGWRTYTHADYGFSFRYPPEWSLEEVQDPQHTMRDHLIRLGLGPDQKVRRLIGFKRAGEDLLLWPTGVGEGEFILKGTALFIGQAVNRNVLVCQNQDMMVFYQQAGGLHRGDVEFSLLLGYVGSCLDNFSIPLDLQTAADKVVASFEMGK
jgi:putative hemolysin